MAKVLISFLGTGKPEERHYRAAKYKISEDICGNADGIEEESPYVARVLMKHLEVDKVILIGTVRSMWEQVYEDYANENGIFDENKWFEIGNYCQSQNSESDLTDFPEEFKKDIKKALGKNAEIVLIHYGINQAHIQKNSDIILGIEKYLNTGDKLLVDITHGFRSLPLYLLNSLLYLKQVSSKNVTIEHITYGMLDVISELGHAPIVDLKGLMEVQDWITGAYAFKEYGHAYKLAELMESENKSLASNLRTFSNTMSLNYLQGIADMIPQLQEPSNLSNKADLIVTPVLKEFKKKLGQQPEKMSLFQYNLAKWHFDHMDYSSSFIALTESIISYVCEAEGKDPKEKNFRDYAKDDIFNNDEYKDLIPIFNSINDCRKEIAHSIRGADNVRNMIGTLSAGLEQWRTIINRKPEDPFRPSYKEL